MVWMYEQACVGMEVEAEEGDDGMQADDEGGSGDEEQEGRQGMASAWDHSMRHGESGHITSHHTGATTIWTVYTPLSLT